MIKKAKGALSGILKKIMTGMIRFYQRFISPMKPYATCKFYPTCSQYAVNAIEKYGPFKGVAMAAWRILRCNPFSKGGYDPVPEAKPQLRMMKMIRDREKDVIRFDKEETN